MAVNASLQQQRGVKTVDFAGTKEKVYGMTNWQIPERTEAQVFDFSAVQNVRTGRGRDYM